MDGQGRYTDELYMPQNCQGIVASVTDQRLKDADHAPQYATYLMIRAVRENKVLEYRVYLGENNTTDFNVRRNTRYSLDITIEGESEVDTRVQCYTLDVYDDLENRLLHPLEGVESAFRHCREYGRAQDKRHGDAPGRRGILFQVQHQSLRTDRDDRPVESKRPKCPAGNLQSARRDRSERMDRIRRAAGR